ncbi:MAG: hypothetical protein J5I92_05455 [Thiogranum sp.]|nr:hypothetical protein [Thiogranum sp.]
MIKAVLTLVCPPLAACRFGCAGCCAAPIGVFWLAGMVSIFYGMAGGPANLMGPSWNTMGLGIALWVIASVWAALTIRGAENRNCETRGRNRLCNRILSDADESDPFEEVRKAR